ncbi:hypothetical protein [Clostridium felsineum]|uniref:Uncharacterized protein n=1 Tax=Clostridium felsineum TaxID=36839 RepID=A0A1S8LWQ6_9CLOT|nr:hypothetical protein [Clostridium felsineum]URZ05908.1 hypothetical protein CLROS_012400 [Clostridium felsineum]URZ10945.1 hypothetical protein CROST_016610 [Clostridium felsineum]
MIRLQQRDIEYLKLLGRFGVLNKSTVDNHYGSHIQYSRYRRKKLADAGYILKNQKISYLSSEGKEYIRSLGIEPRNISGDKRARNRIAKIAEILIPLEKVYKIYPSWEIKNSFADMKLLYYGKIVNPLNSSEYYVYNLGKLSENPSRGAVTLKKRLIRNIREEIVQKSRERLFDRVIIFAENGLTMNLYKGELRTLEVKEQLLLPLTDYGLNLVNLYGIKDVNYAAAKLVYGNVNFSKSNFIFADYVTSDGINIITMINNDMEKLVKLKQYRTMFEYNSTSVRAKIEVVCLEEQERALEEELPGIKIRTVNLEDLELRR